MHVQNKNSLINVNTEKDRPIMEESIYQYYEKKGVLKPVRLAAQLAAVTTIVRLCDHAMPHPCAH